MSNLVISQKAIQLASNLEILEGEINEDIEQQMLELSRSADDAGLFLDRSEYLIKYFKNFRDITWYFIIIWHFQNSNILL